MKIGFVVPTKNRPREMERLLLSLEAQAVRPQAVVIVDGGATSLDACLEMHKRFPIKYILEKSSITEARNRGVEELERDIDIIGFLDDDLVFEPGSLDAMLDFWSKADDRVGGAGFNITNHSVRRKGNVLKWPFFLDSKAPGQMLRSGYNTPYCPVAKTQKVSWLYGGATLWRRKVLETYRFDEWYEGYGLMEDIDFSYNVSKKFDLYVVAESEVLHLHAPGDRVPDMTFGQMQIINRYNFVRKHPEMSFFLFWWANVGQVMENFARWIVFRKKTFILKCFGNLLGMARLILNSQTKIRLNKRAA